jgi:ribosomal protein L7/L12
MKKKVFEYLETRGNFSRGEDRLKEVKAVKLKFDFSLKEAKDLVEEFLIEKKKNPIDEFIDNNGGIDLIKDNKLQAIKNVSREFDLGLGQAKDEIERYYLEH